MRLRLMVVCAIAVAAVIAPMAAMAAPIGDNEVLISERYLNRWDKWDYTAGTLTGDDFVQPGQDSYAAAWANGWKTGGVDDGVADIFVCSNPVGFDPRVYVIDGATATALCDGNSIITDGISFPMDLCVRGDYLYVLNDGNGTVTRYNKQTGVRDTSWIISNLPESSTGLAVTADGSVYVACGAFDPIPWDEIPERPGVPGLQKYNAAGAYVGAIADDVDGASNFFCVREDWDGNLWVTSSYSEWDDVEEDYVGVGYIYKINPATGAVATFWEAGLARMRQLAFTPDRTKVIVVAHDNSHWYSLNIADGAEILDIDTAPQWILGGILSTFNRNETDLPPFGQVDLPIMGASNKAVEDPIMAAAAAKYTWIFWGKVSERSNAGFKIDDGSGVVINVVAAGNTVADNDYVTVKGALNVATKTLTSQSVTKFSP